MSFPTRVELESLKRAALQAKCKELGIKANSKSEVLIDLILEHYQSLSGPSRPTTSSKRKAQDDAKTRRVKPKIEPQETLSLQTSPRRGKVMEVVMRSPAKGRGRGKGKAKAMTPVDDEMNFVKEAPSAVAPFPGPAMTAQPLTHTSTSMTILDTAAEASALPDTRVADLELQIRNARKAGDESAREILALKTFQNAIQQAFGDNSSSDTLDSMGQLAKLRDLAPKLLAASHLDPEAISSRVDAVQKKAAEFEATHKKNRAQIEEMRERVRKLEAELPSVSELEVMVRQLQSQFNRIPDSVFNNERPEDSALDSRYTMIRPTSAAPSAGPSGSQRPSSQLSVPPPVEDGLFPPQNQDQNSGRASSVARSSRSSRPPLAEKEREAEAETDTRRSVCPPSHPQSRQSSQSSRGRSIEPYTRGRSSEPPTPSRGKGKGRLIKTPLDTVNEDEAPILAVADPFTPTMELPRSPPAARNSGSPPPSSGRPISTSLPPLATLGTNGPIAELPFKLIASPTKPASSEVTERPSAPSGRVGVTKGTHRHQHSARRAPTSQSTGTAPPAFNFALPAPSTSTTNGTSSSSSAPANGGHGFITPERLGANFSLFPPTRIDLGRTPGGLAFKTTGRAPPGTPAVTNTLFGTEVARDTRFADLPYDPDASRASISWEEPVWPVGIPRNAANQ